ncbi:pyoverdine/dityrosine biosynthesis protein Dit1 [Crossiella equi]|uniref:Pyoverdine/dityrosine biosynthesis protein Dit1 n=1 Tax=Crossiella equi TaxID=130796 RepID=A0ABS5A5M7_9PSEU|nr:isocyanide synthase family protein [Crossiella equi]MBP2471542.1 pyoverdine/dityrosine biosynthesis protein Dit1 [Crossiella equi]
MLSSTTPARLATRVLELVLAHQRKARTGAQCEQSPCPNCLSAHSVPVARAIAENRPIPLVLPAFPAKSPNRDKVLGYLPDKAEELAVGFLSELCDRIAEVHAPGAELTICSDGRVFGDLIGVSDNHITAYQDAMRTLVASQPGTALSVYTLDDYAPGLSPDDMRHELDTKFTEPLSELRERIRACPDLNAMYLGIVRFLLEDRFGPDYQGTKSALQRESRRRALAVVARSRAWGDLVGVRFPDAVRLSIHPQPCGAPKLGVLLGETPDAWLTPWHAVAVRDGDRYTLMKRIEAVRLGARLVYSAGRPSHYELAR